MPEWLFRAYERAQPRLEAEEYQSYLKLTVAGTGHMKDDAFEQLQRQLHRQALGDSYDPTVVKPASEAEMRALISGMGLSGFRVDIRG